MRTFKTDKIRLIYFFRSVSEYSTDSTTFIMLPLGNINFLNGIPVYRKYWRTFTSSPTVAESGTLSAGTPPLSVGNNLSVSATQITGTYNSTSDLTVTVNFN